MNRLNNRKARLARAAKDVRGPSEGDNICIDKQGGSGTRPLNDSPEDPMEDFYVPLAPQLGHQDEFQGAPPAYKGLVRVFGFLQAVDSAYNFEQFAFRFRPCIA